VNSARYPWHDSCKQQGFTLIEVLITTLIFSFAMLSLTQLQNSASKQSYSAALHHMATLQAFSILEQMRADRVAVLAGQYNVNNSVTVSTAAIDTNTALQQWQTELAHGLPEGQASIECSTIGLCQISIFWRNIVPSQTASQSTVLNFVISSQL